MIDGPTHPNDYSISEALEAANRDYARLRQIHQIDWQFDISGAVRYVCSCPEAKARTSTQMDAHIAKEVRLARGPVKSK